MREHEWTKVAIASLIGNFIPAAKRMWRCSNCRTVLIAYQSHSTLKHVMHYYEVPEDCDLTIIHQVHNL